MGHLCSFGDVKVKANLVLIGFTLESSLSTDRILDLTTSFTGCYLSVSLVLQGYHQYHVVVHQHFFFWLRVSRQIAKAFY
jgi:hypothetical protein